LQQNLLPNKQIFKQMDNGYIDYKDIRVLNQSPSNAPLLQMPSPYIALKEEYSSVKRSA